MIRDITKNILRKFGYIHKSEIQPDYLMLLGVPSDYPKIADIEEQFFKDLSRVDGIDKFLDATMAFDMKREFNSQTDQERNLVKGGYGRTLYFKKGVMEARGLKGQ